MEGKHNQVISLHLTGDSLAIVSCSLLGILVWNLNVGQYLSERYMGALTAEPGKALQLPFHAGICRDKIFTA